MTLARPLSQATLASHAGRVDVPAYDRQALVPSVVHISVGSFHRAHQAVYLDELARQGHTGWGLVGVGLHRPQLRAALEPQDGLYTVVARGGGCAEARVVGAMRDYLFAPEEVAGVLDQLADPRTRLVTLTLTGEGYKLGSAAVQADLAAAAGAPPRSALGYLVEGLRRRRAAGLAPFTVLSCDNLPDNGRLSRDALVAFASERDPALASWIAAEGAFPASMVDRITPGTTDADRAWVAQTFGVQDRWPVLTEPFSQWVVEDRFACGRPPLQDAGVQFVGDVRPYALMKTRLLNAGHCVLGHLGALAGLERIDEVMRVPELAALAEGLLRDEVTPLLAPVPGIDLAAYRRTTLGRFADPAIGDRLERLRRNGSHKVPAHVLSSVQAAREQGVPHLRLTLAVAAWVAALRGTDERGGTLSLEDPWGEELRVRALEGPRAVLTHPAVASPLAGAAVWLEELDAALHQLTRRGVRAAAAVACLPPSATLAA